MAQRRKRASPKPRSRSPQQTVESLRRVLSGERALRKQALAGEKEALEQQAATVEVLGAMSKSPSDAQPVFEAIVDNAHGLCEAAYTVLYRYDGKLIHLVAAKEVDAKAMRAVRSRYPLPPDRNKIVGRAILEKTVFHTADIGKDRRFPASSRIILRRAVISVPLIRNGAVLGVISCGRAEARAFTEREIWLLKTFAAQAVIAIENTRLFNETKEALERQMATAEILRAISGAQTEVQPVFEAIARSSRRLLNGRYAVVVRKVDDALHLVAHTLTAETGAESLQALFPAKLTGVGATGKAVLTGKPAWIVDVQIDPDYSPSFRAGACARGYRSQLTVPIVGKGESIGAITVTRPEPGEFSAQQIELLRTFADQAVIAIENARLFNETKEALEQQTATGEILDVIARSPTNVQPVFDSIAQSCVQLFGGMNVTVTLVRGERIELAAFATKEGLRGREQYDQLFPLPLNNESVSGRAIMSGEVVYMADVADGTLGERTKAFAKAIGYQNVLCAPMIRDGKGIGTINVMRGPTDTASYTRKQIALFQAFANQAVIAIENVRLFNETKEALERQTATAEILRMISALPADVEPVFEAILEKAVRLCDAHLGGLFLRAQDNTWSMVSYKGDDPEVQEAFQSIGAGPHTGFGRLVKTKQPVHIPDLLADSDTGKRDPLRVMTIEKLKARTFFAVPLLKEGEVIGTVIIYRQEVRPFTDSQIRLVATFADQAVIAIENARLFREIQEKSAQLETVNRQLEMADKHKSEFLANMSHELRTPLNAIIGFSEVMMDRMFGDLNEKQAEYVGDIHGSGRHLLSLINDILDLSKIEAGKMELEVSEFHLPDLLESAMILLRERAMRHGIALGLEVAPDVSGVRADERKVKQVLLNLLSNAVKFTPDGGSVRVGARKNGMGVEVSVADTGPGIAPEQHALVFEEFRQVGSDHGRRAEGTGLGLALVKKFVELHGGTVHLKSAPGSGATFTFTLPVAS